MKILVMAIATLWAATVAAADLTLTVPLKDLNTPVVLYLPQAGATCQLLIPVQYLYQWPAATLGDATITQGTSQPSQDSTPSPKPPREGDFNLEAFHQELSQGGRVIRLEFQVPDKMTTIAITAHSFIYNNQWLYTRDAFHKISVEIYPMGPWTEFLESLTNEKMP